MGSLCGKVSNEDKSKGFNGPGRTLGTAPAPVTKASVPATANVRSSATRTVGGPPRTLGESNAAEDAKFAAGAAAEARANKTPTGDLQKKLDAQKKMSHNEIMKSVALENDKHRAADRKKDALNHD